MKASGRRGTPGTAVRPATPTTRLDCGTCSELSNSLDEALFSFYMTLKQLRKALGDRNQERVKALDLDLESAIARRDAAFLAWCDHRKNHEGPGRDGMLPKEGLGICRNEKG